MKKILNIIKDLIIFKAPKENNTFLLEDTKEANHKNKMDNEMLTSDINKEVLSKSNSQKILSEDFNIKLNIDYNLSYLKNIYNVPKN